MDALADLAPPRAPAPAWPVPPLHRPVVIGLTGRGGVGKSTVARALASRIWIAHPGGDECHAGAEIIHTGKPLKLMLAAMYQAAGLPPEEIARRIDGDLKRAPDAVLGGQTPTHAMQTLGTEWGRQMIAPDLWVDLWRRQAERALEDGRAVLNDSVRFENEAAAIRALGGVVVQLVGRAGDLAADHASEAGVAPDLIVENSGTPEECAQDALDAVLSYLEHAPHPTGLDPLGAALRGLWGRVCPALPH